MVWSTPLTGGRGRPRSLADDVDQATFRTLHTASLASAALRTGLTEESAGQALRHLRALLGTAAVALTDTERTLAVDGLDGLDGLDDPEGSDPGAHTAGHRTQAWDVARRAMASGSTEVTRRGARGCAAPGCQVRQVIASPLMVDGVVTGSLVALGGHASATLLRATDEVADWVAGQLARAELDQQRHSHARAEVRALRAQIDPHFVYNSLGAIASFVRTDPARARELLLEFADFTRYSFREHGDFTTLADELRSIERYLLLEQARFGERLRVRLQVAPEVLGVSIPFLCLQPLVENAVRHGLQPRATGGLITIEAHDLDRECQVTVEDDGVGQDPERIRRVLAGEHQGDSVGLSNVDERLRATFGDAYGLVVETAPGAGTRVVVRVPKFAPGVGR